MRSADNEVSGRIDEVLCVFIYHILRKDRIKYVLLNILMDLFLRNGSFMLCGKNDRIQSCRLSIDVLNGNLRFSIRTKIGKSSVFPYLSQLAGQLLSQIVRKRHIFGSLIGSIAKHHSLIAGADCFNLRIGQGILFCLQCFINTESNICRLTVNNLLDLNGPVVKPFIIAVIADFPDGIADNLVDIDVSAGCNFSQDSDKIRACGRFAGYTSVRILCHDRIKNSVGNLVADLVRMSFCN